MLPLLFSTAHLSVFGQYRIFALLPCEVGVRNVLYIGNSGWVVLRMIMSSASGYLEKQRTAALSGSKPPRVFLLARCGIAVTCPEPAVVQEAGLQRQASGASLDKVENLYQPKKSCGAVVYSLAARSLLLRLHLRAIG